MVKYKDAFYCLCFLLFIKPYCFNEIEILDIFVNIGKVILLLYIFMKLLFEKRRRITIFTYLSIVFQIIIILSTILNKGSVYNAFSTAIPMLGIVFFLNLYNEDFMRVLRDFRFMAATYTYINLFSILIIGQSETELKIYFLGSKNGLTIIIPLFLLIIIIHSMVYNKEKNKNILLLFALLISSVLTRSTTLIIELLIFGILWLLQYSKTIKKLLNFWIIFGTYVLSNIFLLSITKIPILLNWLDINLYKGSGSMRSRSLMWQKALKIFADHKILGVGKWTENQWDYLFNGFNYKTQLHNQIVEFLVLGGIVLLVIYFAFCILVGKRIMNYNSNKVAYTVTISSCLALISVLTSAIYGAEFFLILGFGYYIDNVVTLIKPKNSIA